MMYGPDRALWVIIGEIYLLALCRLLSPPAKLIHFLWFKLWKKIGRKLCQTHTYTIHWGTHTHKHSKANNGWIHTHTQTHTLWINACSCRKIVNVKRQKWIMLMAWLTGVFNIMISNPQKIDYITSSLFTWWQKTYCPPQCCGINTKL